MPKPKILGIVNITEDSFSDGGQFLATDKAIEQARELYAAGADVIDLGPAASHPDAEPVTAEQELARLQPVIQALHAEHIPISIDSFLQSTQQFGIKQDVSFLNDVFGFPEPAFYPQLAQADCKLIVMHSIQRDRIANKQVTDPNKIVSMVLDFFETRIADLTTAGIARERLILDPGMGFFLGSNPEASLVMLQNIADLKQTFDLPVLISVSRKSFLRHIAQCDATASGPATLAAELFAANQGVDYIRTHDVKALADALAVYNALM